MEVEQRLVLGGMSCSSCAQTIETALTAINGVHDVSVNAATGIAVVRYDSERVQRQQVHDAIVDVGFEVIREEQPAALPAAPSVQATVMLQIEGMSCTSCSSTIEGVLRNHSAVKSASVSVPTSIATITVELSEISVAEIIEMIEGVGFGAVHLETRELVSASGVTTDRVTLAIENEPFSDEMAKHIISVLNAVDSVKEVEVDKDVAHVHITYQAVDENQSIGARTFLEILNEYSYKGAVVTFGGLSRAQALLARQQEELRTAIWAFVVAFVFTLPVFIMSMVLSFLPMKYNSWMHTMIVPGLNVMVLASWVLSTPVQFYSGWRFYVKSYKTLRAGAVGMDFLIATGTSAAYAYSTISTIIGMVEGKPNDGAHFFETAAFLITIVLLGKVLETSAKGRTSRVMVELASLRPSNARLLTRNEVGEETDMIISAELVQTNDVLRLVTGERVPADGVILSGHVAVDESMLTGESLPVEKEVDAHVFSGTVVEDGTATIRVLRTGDQSTLGKIVALVEDAQASKPPIQQLADSISGFFVPAVAVCSIITFVLWISLSAAGVVPKEWYEDQSNYVFFSFMFGLAVWVIACPCALGLATPTAVMVATGVAAKHGLLVKKGAGLQAAANVTHVMFDKTGTLTTGQTEVTDIHFLQERNLVDLTVLYQLMHAAECRSSHPLAKAVVRFTQLRLEELGAPVSPTATSNIKSETDSEDEAEYQVLKGLGVSYRDAQHTILLGNKDLLLGSGVSLTTAAEAKADAYRAGGKVALYVACDGQLTAVLGIADQLRPDARIVVSELNHQNIQCWMITGDHHVTAYAVAQIIGIPSAHVRANVRPEDKEAVVAELQANGAVVAFVGDGINDSPALSRADVGIAMASGTDVAMEAGDFILSRSHLGDLLTALHLSRVALRRIKFNYFWALIYNTIGIPIAAGALFPVLKISLPPELAAAAMALSSVSVVLSSLALNLYSPPSAVKDSLDQSLHLPRPSTEETYCDCPVSSIQFQEAKAHMFRLRASKPSIAVGSGCGCNAGNCRCGGGCQCNSRAFLISREV